ncbi:UNVERIFIED_CONTAM: hypothetical protein Slati_3014500 [Sesamum latifolium]|uniref:Retrotransposon gag domain-containing protein n=1 Tax=Sesamum latifolium TaxID=2727402 RepID=A0AAW2VG04_9LAMI
MPAENDVEYVDWKRADCMVISWLLNSISKDIVDAFLYMSLARELWKLEERFGECNGPQLYQIQREISSISQGGSTVVVYYTKLKRLWDELNCLMRISVCTCGASRSVNELASFNRLMKFLKGLDENYDHIRNQILLMEPLPSVNKPYSMVLRVEKQREVHMLFDQEGNISMMVRGQEISKPSGRQQLSKFVSKKGKASRCRTKEIKSVNCKITGHTKESCFKLIGYPD